MSFEPRYETSTQLLDEYIARSWRSNAQRQRAKGADFVIGKREGVYMWNLEGTHRIIDCGVGGGVHSMGHRHPEVLAELRKALDDGRDTGLWSVPNAPYLALQDRLAELSPTPELTHSVVTLCSTLTVDMAAMFSLRVTGRSKILAYAHGYHGHSGFAAMVTGSEVEGVIDHYNLPTNSVAFFEEYGNLEHVAEKMTDDVAAIIIEPMDYESFQFASQEFMDGVTKLCRERGVLFIIDETRTGLGRTGKLWASQHYDLKPDILVTGKGLSGGLYPVSALITTEEIYEKCMNEHDFAYLSSLGGNEISCVVALKVLDLVSDPALLEHVNEVSVYLREKFQEIGKSHHNLIGPVHTLGAVQSVSVFDLTIAREIYSNLFKNGVLCHSVCEVGVPTIKFLPPIVLTKSEADEIAEALRASIAEL
jgi:putrescine aminotransferase